MFVVGPGDPHRLQVSLFKAGVGDGPDDLVFVILGKADPHHRITAIFGDNVTHLLQKCRLIGGVQQRLVAVVQGLEGAIEFLELRFRPLALGDISIIDANNPYARKVVNRLMERRSVGSDLANNYLFGIGFECGDRGSYFR